MELITTGSCREPRPIQPAIIAGIAVLVAGLSLVLLPAPNRGLAAASLLVSLSAIVLFAWFGRRTAHADENLQRQDAQDPDATQDFFCTPELLVAYHALARYIRELSHQTDEVLREATMLKLVSIQDEVRALADGKVGFLASEGWRTVYERLLRSPDVRSYRSVAWVRTEDYWRDAPGRRSMQLNFERLRDGVTIERILILGDFFWPAGTLLPSAAVGRWIDEQHDAGIRVGLVRESEIESEPDLLCDFGIYGNRATGWLEVDLQCRTTRFTFDFSPDTLRLAEERWKRLALYAIPYANLLDPGTRRA